MTHPLILRPLAVILAMVMSLLVAHSVASAEGEAGLVVDFGNGEVITFCVPFDGADISGSQMMAAVGLNVNQFSGLVCSIDGTGCTHSGSFDSCTCECQPGSGSCTYWSFFNQRYGGSWVYAASGFQSARSKDGDLQAWKWGAGGANSAPPPGAISFEQVCGHPPQGGVSEPPTATLVPPTATSVPPTAVPTSPPVSTDVPATTAPATATTGTTPRVTITAAASAAAGSPTAAASASPGATARSTTTAAPTGSPAATGTADPATASASVTGSPEVRVTPGRTTISPSVAPRQTVAADDSGDGGSNAGNLVAFAVIAGLLAAAIGVAVIRGKSS